MTKVLWGTRKGDQNWQEELITEDETRIEAAKKWAEANGFDRLRVSEFNEGEAPDFTKILN